ncbi:MAG: YggS family pyridoxal phosphate-dependent enzyme [Candidatus Deferrimicrobium sp.]|jgi:PLP dependent protein
MSPPGAAPDEDASIGERAAWVRDRIADAARRSGRQPGSVKLVAASKTQPLARILEAHAAGLSVFGENYVQEAEEKIRGLPGAEWHLIGRLQGNKVRRAVALFSWIQTVDSSRRLREISRCAAESGKTARVLIEVNLGGEGNKAGAAPGDLRAILDDSAGLPGIRVEGFMAIPPYSADPEGSRPHFARLRELRDALAREIPGAALGELSMGMSNDFEQAVGEGATMVRVGTAIFGSRQGRG